jgi:hypothetical protein
MKERRALASIREMAERIYSVAQLDRLLAGMSPLELGETLRLMRPHLAQHLQGYGL